MKYLLILFVILASCNDLGNKENQGDKNTAKTYSTECKQRIIFSKSKDINGLFNTKGDSIPFALSYQKDTCYIIEDIKFYRLNIMLKSKKFLDSYICLGVKGDSVYVGQLANSKIEDLYYLLSLADSNFPKNLKNTFLFSRNLTIDSVYHSNNEKIFRIESFYDIPHGDRPRYTFDKFFLSKERGIFKVQVIDNEINEIYFSR